MARAVLYIVIHTTATVQNAKVESIQSYWRNTLKWKSPGYAKIIEANGNVVTLASDDQVTNGVAGYNNNSLHVSYIGGIDAKGNALDNRTEAQKYALAAVVAEWKKKYPNAIVQGHRDFPGVAKACPCFNAKPWWKAIENAIKANQI
ncbi:N-acetylmuramoyl-L-alanine amidase [Pontibacter qinzhouensis]|uniref:N-acetylmuramoyl-L-alanine amidase n=1 Tax=Pontibacter qinzhouensis TaxID=2603253 RepID=A0A5C8KB37_9BACT|nr:N-acetylmuramoyl-L-alanine amidase [Pontibacter qinzhouensis]TXK52404.1 N-acetylmuramoyl-L-alanine amidase [Pontibacter qinzhouensis]